MNARSTRCTPPPGRWPSGAIRCSRPPSRRCVGSACAPGESARSPPPPSCCCTTSTAAPHDQQTGRAVTGNGSVAQGALVDPQVTSDLGDRPAGLEHHLHGLSLELRAELPPLLGHGRILSGGGPCPRSLVHPTLPPQTG